MNKIHEEQSKKYADLEMLDDETMGMLKEFAHGSPEIIQDILDSFEPEGSLIILEIKKSIAEKNAELLKTSAHSLSGISGSIGAVRLRQICSDAENEVKAGNIENAFVIATLIFGAYNELTELLKKV